jgi:phosphatidylserine/phosphatidylglycerophosphate/cardiolipin synthase-like enzyme
MHQTMRFVLALLLLSSGPASAAIVVTPVVGAPAGAASLGAAAAASASLSNGVAPLSAPLLAAPLAGSALPSAPAASVRAAALPASAAGLAAAPALAPRAAASVPSAPSASPAGAVTAAVPAAVPFSLPSAPPSGDARFAPANSNEADDQSHPSALRQAAAPAAKPDESAEDLAVRSEKFFDQSADRETLSRETLAALPDGAAGILAAVQIAPSEVVGDDGGGADYPHRDVKFNGKTFPSVAFRPNTPIEPLLVQAIDAAKKSIRVSLYEFSSRNVLQALQRAKRRGVNVQIILDYSNSFPENEPGAEYRRRRSEQIWGLVRDKFDLRILRGETQFGINHNKFAVFDGKMAEFGSYNWSYTSEHSHYENANFSIEKPRVAALGAYWDYLWERAVPEAQARMHVWAETVPAPPAEADPSVSFNGIKLPLYVFTPGDKLEDVLVSAIDAARTSVDYAMFSPRSTKVAQALKRAADRGLKVRAVIDESQSQSEYFKPFSDWLASNGVEVKTLSGPNGPESDFPMAEKMHNKFMILDGKLVETGSANHTKRASMDNYENAQFLSDATDAAGFVFHFTHLWAVSRPLPRPLTASIPTDEQLRDDILHPKVTPAPPAPTSPIELPAAPTLTFRGRAYPTSAFRPYEPVAEHVVAAIDAAQKTLRISIYQFEQQSVLDALNRAKKRGVKVEVVLDRSHVYVTGTSHEGGPRKPRPMIVELVKSGFDLLILKGQGSGIMHNKFVIVDDELLEGGSYNYTDQSENDHFENVFFTLDKARVALYLRYYKYMRDQAEPVDMDKLEEILNRTEEAEGPSLAETETAASLDAEAIDTEASKRHPDPDGRTSKFPAPPVDEESPIAFNGQHFPRAIFSPQGGIEEALVRAVEAAKESIDIAMFSFFSRRIGEALLAAKNRGVKVRLALDKSQASLSSLDDWFAWHDFEMRLLVGPDDTRDPLYQKMHNKFGVFDGKLVETGSFNYSPNAEKNSFENSNWFDAPEMAARYAAFFERMFSQGVKARKPKREPKWKPSKD